MNIGKILTRYRNERGITQRALADRLNCSITAVNLWETGGKMPSVRNRLQIAEVLGIPVADVMPEFDREPGTTEYVTEPALVDLVRQYRELPPPMRQALNLTARALVEALTTQEHAPG